MAKIGARKSAVDQKALIAIVLKHYKELIAALRREELFLQELIIAEKDRERAERLAAVLKQKR